MTKSAKSLRRADSGLHFLPWGLNTEQQHVTATGTAVIRSQGSNQGREFAHFPKLRSVASTFACRPSFAPTKSRTGLCLRATSSICSPLTCWPFLEVGGPQAAKTRSLLISLTKVTATITFGWQGIGPQSQLLWRSKKHFYLDWIFFGMRE